MSYITRKVIMVGKTGNGKSSLGNNLLGEKCFRKGCGFTAVTTECHLEKNEKVEIVDTPGLFDTDRKINVANQALKIVDALKRCQKPHAFLIVVKFDRYTSEEKTVIDVLRISLGVQCFQHAIIVFTHVENDLSDEMFKRACREATEVDSLIKLCGGRVGRIDNKEPKTEHVDNIFKCIESLSKNGQSSFKNEYSSCREEVLNHYADLNRYDTTRVHKQVEIIAQNILKKIDEMIEIEMKKEAKSKELEEKQKEKEKRNEKIKNAIYFGSGVLATALFAIL